MASVASAGASAAAALPSPTSSLSNGSKTNMKPATKSKASEGNVKQTANAIDGAPRRPNSQKAWAPGTNPLTQRSPAVTSPQNGNVLQPKTPTNSKAISHKEMGSAEKLAHERLVFIFSAAVGSIAVVTAHNGDKYEGIVTTSTPEDPDPTVTLKMTTLRKNDATQPDRGTLVGSVLDYAMTFNVREISEISIAEMSLPEPAKTTTNGSVTHFQTDGAISGTVSRGERKLQRWVPDGNDVDMSLDSAGGKGWDQFETNNRLFGASSTYDENIYTTQIDRSAPSYKRREAEAARIAREIENTTSTNSHMREERGQAFENDGEDEEDKYSGVRRDEHTFPPLSSGAPNKYMPPARRAPTGQATVPGAPVDPAIISAQMARPDGTKVGLPKTKQQVAQVVPEETKPKVNGEKALTPTTTATTDSPKSPSGQTSAASMSASLTADSQDGGESKPRNVHSSVSPQRPSAAEDPTKDVEIKVLDHFKQFANSEKQRIAERRRVQANQDRTAKLNDLLRFSKTFKLNTPIPTDLVGILAKDPKKQEQIIEKAQKEHQESSSATTSPTSTTDTKLQPRVPATTKVEPANVPAPLIDRQPFGRGRGYPSVPGRNERFGQSATFSGRGASNFLAQRSTGKAGPPHPIPAPIPIHDGRVPPLGPMGSQSGLSSPQRSSVHTPTSAVSTKYNVNAIAFRPNAAAPAFNPSSASNAPSSPVSVSMQMTRSVSRTKSPSAFFGSKNPKAISERPSTSDHFNPIKRLKVEVEADKDAKKKYPLNGGIPHAYQTGPRWIVKDENADATYLTAFDKLMTPLLSPAQSRSNSHPHAPYQNQVPPHMQNGLHSIPQISTPHHGRAAQPHQYPPHFEGDHQRMAMPAASPQIYASPRVQPGQMLYASPMAHPAQLAYGQPVQPYFANHAGQSPMQIRQYPGSGQFVHTQGGQLAAPIMVQQQSNGPYMPPQPPFTPQMQMYSPMPAHAYPQQGGYPSPGRAAPMMMQQGSQQGHYPTPPNIYGMPAQPGQMMYPQQSGQMMRPGYATQQGGYGTSPHQQHQYPPRSMSSGYGHNSHKMMPKAMQNQAHPPNGPQQGHYGPPDGPDEAK